MKVVTYNVHSFGNEITGFSAKEFAEMMNKEETDVLCFQEYRGNGDFTEQDLQNTYAKTFPYSFIPEGLSQAIYSRYPIRQSQTIEFPNTNNGAIWADLDVKGMTIRIINVHMQTTSFDRMRSKAAQLGENKMRNRKEAFIWAILTTSGKILSDVPDRLNKSVR